MKIKTDSGVSISTISGSSLVPGSSSVLIIFSKPVSAIELTKQELPHFAALLTGSDLETSIKSKGRKKNKTTIETLNRGGRKDE
jgi:hypothetical protein